MAADSSFAILQFVARYVRPRARVDSLAQLSPELLSQRGIRGLILDLDNTLVPWNTTRLTPETRAWLETVREHGVQLCIISNSAGDSRVQFVGESLGIPYVSKAVKPSQRAFRLALAEMNLSAEQVAVAGDQLFTDVLGGNRLGLFTGLVTPITRKDFIATKVMRFLERLIGAVLRRVPVETESLT